MEPKAWKNVSRSLAFQRLKGSRGVALAGTSKKDIDCSLCIRPCRASCLATFVLEIILYPMKLHASTCHLREELEVEGAVVVASTRQTMPLLVLLKKNNAPGMALKTMGTEPPRFCIGSIV